MNVKKRLLTFIAYTGQSVSEFDRSCGLANAYVRNIKQTIMPGKLNAILRQYPELNCDWLLTGRGKMLFTKVPVINFDATIYFDEYARLLECCVYLDKPNRSELLTLQSSVAKTIDYLEQKGVIHGHLDLLFKRVLRLQQYLEK